MDIKKLSEPELKALALRKNAQGCATASALKAQAILYERLHWPSYNELHDSQRNPRVPMWWVRCKLCGATSATHSTKEKAVAAWNGRTYDKS